MHSSLKKAFILITLAFLGLFLATFFTVRIALSGHTGPIDKDYYEKGLNYENVIAEQKEMILKGYSFKIDSSLLSSGVLELKKGKQNFAISLEKLGQPVSEANITLKIERSATDKFNQSVQLSEKKKGIYQGELNIPMTGVWQASLTAKTPEGMYAKGYTIQVVQ
ncbi:hypothetical protein CH373_05130 [Leptospira perolatii]|uniref:Nitrogen fixation protein FixH n=1 Tax=Leptospira perolatii TaxID=2023191 RepID=A0A2M9ZQT8_9LEPT|nr:FixH family protein [Leptospira perolatii]PJZ70457.1 hypothetical protein CH360_05550 [Leptospira perolatii]PJZ74293.1 hypothetical protein CH373_05130 [Leptospira perolatii]